jgi:hypothetical protein
MKNSIDAHIEFSFKGETHSMTSSIDLNVLMENNNSLLSVHSILAKEHDIDTYSYLYEVMQETEIEFKNAQGIAAKFLHDGTFDYDGFASSWQEHNVLALLKPIASRELGIADLDQHQGLKNALVQAYNLGKQS